MRLIANAILKAEPKLLITRHL